MAKKFIITTDSKNTKKPTLDYSRIIEEIKQIPNDKLEEIYDLIHCFCLGVTQEKQSQGINVKQRPIGLYKGKFQVPASFFEPLTDEMLDAFEGK